MLRKTLNLCESVVAKRVNNAGILTLNRPKALNALNHEMVISMHAQLRTWMKEKDVKLVIQNAEGGKAFCAGGDIRSITDAGRNGDMVQILQKIFKDCKIFYFFRKTAILPGCNFFNDEYRLNYALHTLPVPLVSIIDGITMGGGVGLSVHGTFRVATEKTLFAMPETGIGLFPDVGGGYFLPRLPDDLGTFLALTGHRVKGVDNVHAGIATHICEKEKIPLLTEKLTGCANEKDVEDVLLEFQENSLKQNVDLNRSFTLLDNMDTIKECFKYDSIDEIKSALANGSDWAKKQLDTINKMSPTSLAITLKQLRKGADLNLKQVLKMESQIGATCMKKTDFYEGVRAVLIDRDNSPKWAEFDGDIEEYFKESSWEAEEWV